MIGAVGLDSVLEGETLRNNAIAATIVFVAGVIAVVGPARRSLRIQPTEALREE